MTVPREIFALRVVDAGEATGVTGARRFISNVRSGEIAVHGPRHLAVVAVLPIKG